MIKYAFFCLAAVFVVSYLLRKYFRRRRLSPHGDLSWYSWEDRMWGTSFISGLLTLFAGTIMLATSLSTSSQSQLSWLIEGLAAEDDRFGPAAEPGHVHEVRPIPGTSLAFALVVLESEPSAAYLVPVAAAAAPKPGEQVQVKKVEYRISKLLDPEVDRRYQINFGGWMRVLAVDSQ